MAVKMMNLVGHKYGRLKVVRFSHRKKYEKFWCCDCDCGGNTITRGAALRGGTTKSCGCLVRETRKNDMKFDLIGKRFHQIVVIGRNTEIDGDMNWFCKCDCGKEFYASKNGLTTGMWKSCGCWRASRKGKTHPNWKGGRLKTGGYIKIHQPEHPYSTKAGYVYEHRLVIEKSIGRYLRRFENVHHKNGNRSDNRIENLELWVTMQPSGQRPKDLIKYAKRILALYENETA